MEGFLSLSFGFFGAGFSLTQAVSILGEMIGEQTLTTLLTMKFAPMVGSLKRRFVETAFKQKSLLPKQM